MSRPKIRMQHKMTKSDLIQKLSDKEPTLSRRDMELVVNTVFDQMREALVGGDRIEIRGFGSFSVKDRESREGRNPKTGAVVEVPAKRVPYFKVGKELRERVDS